MKDKPILVVDDELDLLAMVRSIFERAGFTQIITASSGEAALDEFFKKKPAMAILDVMMPDMDGFELLREIRQISGIPVLMLTAKGEAEDRCRGLELGGRRLSGQAFSAQGASSAGQRNFETGISRRQSDGNSCCIHSGFRPCGGPPGRNGFLSDRKGVRNFSEAGGECRACRHHWRSMSGRLRRNLDRI